MIEVKPGNPDTFTLKALTSITVTNTGGSAAVYFDGALLNATHTGTKVYGPFKATGKLKIVSTATSTYYKTTSVRGIGSDPTTPHVLGPVDSLETLNTVFPAINNEGMDSLVGTAPPYIRYVSNGIDWVIASGIEDGKSPLLRELKNSKWSLDDASLAALQLSGFSGGIQFVKSSLNIVGDSRMAFGAPTVGNDSVTGVPTGYNSPSFIMWANDHLNANGLGFDMVYNHSQGGDTIATSRSSGRFAAAVADAVDCCMMMFMHNDLSPAGGALTVQQFLIAYEAALVELLATKKVVMVCSGTPLVSSASAAYSKAWYRFKAANAGLKALCSKYASKGAIYLDLYSSLVDNTTATFDALSGTIQTDDGVHFQTKGAQICGHDIAQQIAGKLSLTGFKTKGANLLPAFTGSGGTKTGTFTCSTQNVLPAAWDLQLVSGGGASTAVTVSSVTGGIYRLAFDNTTGGTEAKFSLRLNTSYQTSVGVQISNGDMIQAQYGFEMMDNVGCNLGGYIRINGSNSYVALMGGKNSNEETLVVQTAGVAGIRKSHAFSVTVVPTFVEVVIEVTVPATTGVCTLDVWSVELFKLT